MCGWVVHRSTGWRFCYLVLSTCVYIIMYVKIEGTVGDFMNALLCEKTNNPLQVGKRGHYFHDLND